jgi:hypothetical protein
LANSLRPLCVIATVIFSSFGAFAQEATSAPPAPATPVSWEDSLWLPARHFLQSLFESPAIAAPAPVATVTTTAFDPEPGCSVAPLDPIDDTSAKELEASTGSSVVDVADMVPAAAHALDLFESKVASVGGTMILKSAYRPAAYQKHLQNVWYKWMGELKNNTDPGCEVLRSEVQEEFERHRLIETQHPVAVSDHTRGLAFDATVELPAAKKTRGRLTLDGLARMAGLLRPAIAADPVHFKFLGALRAPRTVALRRRRISA